MYTHTIHVHVGTRYMYMYSVQVFIIQVLTWCTTILYSHIQVYMCVHVLVSILHVRRDTLYIVQVHVYTCTCTRIHVLKIEYYINLMMLMMVLIQRKFVYSLIDFYNKKFNDCTTYNSVERGRQGDRERERMI